MLLVWLNRSIASSRGVASWTVETVFTIAVAVTVTLSISWVGLMVINSMLLLPAAAARNLARSSRGYVLWAVAIGSVCGVAGLITSFYSGTATGATVVLFSMAVFIVSLPFRRR
jgi:zinc transport system permease protein